MKNRKNTIWILAATFALATASACTKSENPASQPPTSTAPQQQAQIQSAAPQTAPAAQGGEISLSLATDGDNLYFDKKTLDVKAGSTVKLTFTNNSAPASGLSHNWVLCKPGTEGQVATDSMSAGEGNGWVANGPNVIAHTSLTKGKTSETITFTAPPAGDYPYICTYPGHSMTMKGVLHSK